MAVVVAWLLLAAACSGERAAEEEVVPAEVPTIVADLAQVERETMVEELVVRGTVVAEPNQDAKVAALVPGRVDAVTVAEGDAVRRGQVIAELDRRLLDDERREAVAAVEEAKALLENARLSFERNRGLFERGIAAGKEVDDARAQLAAAQSALEQAQAALSTADRNVGWASVRSPIDGQVMKRMVSAGEPVDGTAAQPIVEIVNLDRVELAASVPAERIPRVQVGQAVEVVSDAYRGETFPGSVIAVAPAVDPTTNAGLVRIRVANTDRRLKVGMFAEAHVVLAEHPQSLVVPRSAVVRDERGPAVYVVTGERVLRTPVTTGLERADRIEIVSGVEPGQTVLASAVYGLGEQAKLARAGASESP